VSVEDPSASSDEVETVDLPDNVDTVDLLGDAARDERAALIERARAVGTDEGTGIRIGRYHLLELVGAGGMGMVWGAWDPQLERRVALKLVQRMSPSALERIRREGQVLARLSHPNVVPIFDLGTAGDQMYLVMEWVIGTTLRRYAGERPGWRGVVDAYRQAGAGLDAAHQAGVVHRDFKPDNVIRGDDGRVRVLDFGLAGITAGDGSGDAPLGTPRYRSPERERGEPATAASDQYAFGVSLREGLEANPGAPAWIQAVVARATAAAAGDRFPSMQALLAALVRDPARRRLRIALGAALAAAAVGAFAVGRTMTDGGGGAPAIDPCSGGPAAIAESWNPAVRALVSAHLHGLGKLDDAAITKSTGDLDAYAARWVAVQRGACFAHARNTLSAPQYEQQLRCLARTRVQLGTVGELLSSIDTDGVAAALAAVASLPDVTACRLLESNITPPPAAIAAEVAAVAARIDRTFILVEALRPDTLEAARAATADARRTGYAPLIARALLVEGRALLDNTDDPAGPKAALGESWRTALAASDDILAVEAYARWIWGRAIHGDVESEGWPMMEALANRLGPAGRFSRALLYNNRAVVHVVQEDHARARELFDRAAKEAEGAPEGELLAIWVNRAVMATDLATARPAMQDAFVRTRRAYGADHPKTLQARLGVAQLDPDLAAAHAELTHVCSAWLRWHAGDASICVAAAAWIADALGDVDAALRWMRTLEQHGPRLDERDMGAAYVAARTRAPDTARLVAVILEHARNEGKPLRFWNHSYAADAHRVAAIAAEGMGDRTATVRHLTTALEHFQRANSMYYDRRADSTRAELMRLGAPVPPPAVRPPR
jgi:eukaryotic-like serine/threonine-protein kinase